MKKIRNGFVLSISTMAAVILLSTISVPAYAGKVNSLSQPQVLDKRGSTVKKTIKRTRQRLRLQSYRQLIAPNNRCTQLVRKVCGQNNQCAASSGCAPARQLLDRYNQRSGAERQQTEGSCLAGLEDGIIFAQCQGG